VSRVGRWLRALIVAGSLLASGCAQATPPGETVPELRTHLAWIDRALAGERYGTARRSLEALVRTTTDARATGRLSPERADRILAAAARLAADLPEQQPTTTKPPVDDQQGQRKDEHKDDKHKDEGKEGDGDEGHDGGNGPDDGHGN
jgi:hypothetical protein